MPEELKSMARTAMQAEEVPVVTPQADHGEDEFTIVKGKKKAKVMHHVADSHLVEQMTAGMPEEIRDVKRDTTPLVRADVRPNPQYVSAYELKIPAKDENGVDIDPHHWCRERGIVPVRRYVAECVGHPELGAIRTWATGASDAIMLFCQKRKIKNAHMFEFRAVEDPPAKAAPAKK